jgi:PAS domain S-box-containing protein
MSSLRPSSRHFLSAEEIKNPKRRRFFSLITTSVVIVAVACGLFTLRQQLFFSMYLPHYYCYLGNQRLVWTHVFMDTLIGICYMAISVTLAVIVYRGRRDIPFRWMFLAFGLFIIACGFTHFMDVVTIWVPLYVLSAVVKTLTATASLTTAAVLPFIVPSVLEMVHKAKQSDEYLRFLESGLSERDAAHGELQKINELLEARVRERTEELERANEEIKVSERHYRFLFESSPMPMWVFDVSNFQFLAVNEAAIRHYGYSRQEFLSMSILDIRPSDDIPRAIRAVSMGSSEEEIWRHRKKDGTVIEVEITGHPMNFDGKSSRLVLCHDVTRQRQYQESLRHSEERFSKAFHSSPLPIMISTEKEGRYVDANDAFEKMIGYQREELLGETSERLAVWVEPAARTAMTRHLDEADKKAPLETLFRTKSGEHRLVQITAERVFLDGEPCVLANTLDVTESRRLEEQFRQSQKMEAVGRLAGGVAHDFNNILSVMMGYAELAQILTPRENNISRHLEQIKQAGYRATVLTRQLLAFSRQQVLEVRILNLSSVVRKFNEMMLRVIGEDVTLVLKLAENLGSVKADLGQIEQVLMNLVINARDAMPEGGNIVIETGSAEVDETYVRQHPGVAMGRYITFSVSDTGYGIDAETLPHIFEPFFTTKAPGEGTGLGLSTAYGIVKQSGGHIEVYSEIMRGTIFKVYLPVVSEAAEAVVVPAAEDGFDHGNETILLVEDDISLRTLSAELLRRAGYTVMEAIDAKGAIEIAKERNGVIDLVLTDVIMPGMTGADLAAYLRHLWPDMTILFMSGYASDHISRAGVPESETHILEKPFTRKSLLRRVRAVLDSTRL